MEEEDNTENNEATEEKQGQNKNAPAETDGQQPWKENLFSNQVEAYQWLQWACPQEYHFKAGVLPDGKRAVLVKTPQA